MNLFYLILSIETPLLPTTTNFTSHLNTRLKIG